MKRLLHNPRQRPEKAVSKEKTKVPSAIGSTILSGFLLLSQLPDAKAERPLPQPEKCMEGKHRGMDYVLYGKKVIVYAEEGGMYGCLVYGKDNRNVILNIHSSNFTMDFYPFVEKKEFALRKKVESGVAYDVNGKLQSRKALVGLSNLKIKGVELPPGWGLGTPIGVDFSPKSDEKDDALALVPLTPDTIIVTSGDGVVVLKSQKGHQLVGPRPTRDELDSTDEEPPLVQITLKKEEKPAEKPPEKPFSSEKPAEKPALEETAKKPPIISVSEPLVEASPSEEEESASPPIIIGEAERITFSGLGEHGNSGEINDAELLGAIGLTDGLSLVVGASTGIYNLSSETNEAENKLGLLSVNAVLGIRFDSGRHAIFAMPYGGVNYVTPDLISKLERPGSKYSLLEFEFGGRAGYEYGEFFGVSVQGSNNPFNPGLVRLYAALPYSWVEDAYPRLDVVSRWLHLIRPNNDGSLGGELDYNNILTNANLKLPIAPLGPVLPSAIAGLEVNIASNDEVNVDGYFGGTLAILLGRIRLEGGYLHSINGNHMIIVKGGLLSH
jgi:hypothetical protein